MTTETNKWVPTRKGGFRRLPQAGVAQLVKDEATDSKEEAGGTAVPNVGAGDESVESEERLRNTQEGGGSNPSPGTPKFIFKMNEKLGLDTCPYLIRWRFETPWGSIRLHHWLGQDDPRHRHDHPWSFVTFVLKGGYTDLSPAGDQHLKAPAVQYRDATHQHTVVPDEGGAWTVIVTGPKIREWGFWVNGKFRSRIKYFWKFGHHPCD